MGLKVRRRPSHFLRFTGLSMDAGMDKSGITQPHRKLGPKRAKAPVTRSISIQTFVWRVVQNKITFRACYETVVQRPLRLSLFVKAEDVAHLNNSSTGAFTSHRA